MDKQDEKGIIRIKHTRGYIPLFFMLSVVLMALSIYCIVYAYTTEQTGTAAIIFYVAGAIGTLFFAYSAFDNLFQTIQPKNALVIGKDGFADFTIGGVGVGAVKWSNVKSVKTVRSKNGRLLMIALNDMGSVLENAPKAAQKAILNSSWDDDSIAICQMDVAERLADIIEIFNSHLRSKNTEKECGKTKVISDEEVNSLLRSMREQETKAIELEPPTEKAAQESDNLAETISIPDINAVFEAPAASDSYDDAPTAEIKLDEILAGIEASSKTEEPEADKAQEVQEANEDVMTNLDSIINTVKEDNNSKNEKNIDALMAKFSDEVKSGESRLSDSERSELTDELNAMLADIRRKKYINK